MGRKCLSISSIHTRMEKIEKIVSTIEESIAEIKSEITMAKEKGFVYARAKNIRKAAQALKISAQDLRTVTSEEFKAKKE